MEKKTDENKISWERMIYIKAKKLVIYGFDNLENHDALYVIEEKIFVDDSNGTAHKKLGDYVSNKSITPYLGWDGNVYPKFVIADINLD